MYVLGFDLGSSSVKAALLDVDTGNCVASDFHPKTEMPIAAIQPGWAEQDPQMWWDALTQLSQKIMHGRDKSQVKAIGISYQMHGLVLVDKLQRVLRPSIIWCDSRSVEIGEQAFRDIGPEKCLSRLLNSPGNFTASKLKWVRENEPELYTQIDKIMLPGDYIAMKMTGRANTTTSGLSEGIFWDFQENSVADFLLQYYGFEKSLIPELVPSFAAQGQLSRNAADMLGLAQGTPVTYRAGDQPNNALSLNVLQAGDIAATAGTSGVIYGVSEHLKYDPQSRVNSFAHVNHQGQDPRLGVLLCINGTGILNAWLKNNTGPVSYDQMNALAAEISVGSDGLQILPFGNGAERVLNNKNIGCRILGLDFNQHSKAHLFRAAQEGIVFSLKYGLDIMQEMGIRPRVIRAGQANMFLSPIFRNTLANLCGIPIELYNTDGAQGAARGAAIGLGIHNFEEAFAGLKVLEKVEPEVEQQAYADAYQGWLEALESVV